MVLQCNSYKIIMANEKLFIKIAGLYWRVQMMDLVTYSIAFVALTILSTWLVAYAYRNTKVNLKHK